MTLADRLRAALAGPLPVGAVIQNADLEQEDMLPPTREAAVLMAITDRPQPGLILTQRHADLRAHAGQVALPGGRLDPGEDAVQAALREAEEEIALPPSAVEVIGTGDVYVIGSGYRITPVIGVVPADLPLTPSEAEVDAVFEVPLAFLLDAANREQKVMAWRGRDRTFWEYRWPERRIWGATAAMLVNLSWRIAHA